MKKQAVTKGVCLLLALAMILGAFSACGKTKQTEEGTTEPAEQITAAQETYSAVPGSVKKSETVFINLDTAGQPKSIVVSDWLHTDKAGVRVDDLSDSTSIVNVKGLEQPIISSEAVTWNMSSTDLYYRGYSTKPLPVDIGLRYNFNGSPAAAEDISGKTGQLSVQIDLTNNISETVSIDGEDVKIYCPFLVIGGTILADSSYADVSVTGGRLLSDGAKQAALFVSVPGLKESLGLDTLNVNNIYGFDFPDAFSLSANVTNCTVGNMYFAVLPLSALGFGNVITDDMQQLEDILKKLTDIVNSLYDLNAGKLINILTGNSDNITTLLDAVNDAAKLYQSNQKLLSVLSAYLTKENTDAIASLITDLEGVDIQSMAQVLSDPSVTALISDINNADLSRYSELLSNPLLSALFSDLSGLMKDASTALPALEKFSASISDGQMQKLLDDINALLPTVERVSADLADPEIKQSLDKLPETVSTLEGIVNKLKANKELLDGLSAFATKENINKISSMLDGVNATELSALLGLAGTSAEVAEKLLPRMESVLNLGNSYTIYSKAPESMSTAVMFVYQTPGF